MNKLQEPQNLVLVRPLALNMPVTFIILLCPKALAEPLLHRSQGPVDPTNDSAVSQEDLRCHGHG